METACCNSQIIAENLQLNKKLSQNDQGGATEEAILCSQKPSCLCWEIQAVQRSKEKWLKYTNRRCRRVVEISVTIYLT